MVVPPDSAGGSGPLWFVRDNAYVLATLVFIGSIGVMLWTRRHAPSPSSTLTSPASSLPGTRDCGSMQ